MRSKLLLFTNSAELFLSHRMHLARGARESGHDVQLLCPPGPAVAEIEREGFRCHTVSMGRKSLNPLRELWTCVLIGRALLRVKPDVFHCFTIKCVFYGTLMGRILGIGQIANTVTGRGHVFIDSGFRAWAVRTLLSAFYLWLFKSPRVTFIFQNNDDAALYRSNNWVAENQYHVIPGTGVDTERFKPSAPPAPPVTVLFAGRFLREKGLVELIEACDRLAADGLAFRLLLCGQPDPGNPSSLTKEFLEDVRRRNYVEWLGQRSDMERVYSRAHVVCLPSYAEGLPLTLIEAASCGLPIVATDVPGCRDVVLNGENGWLVENKNVESLRAALQRIIHDQVARERFGRFSRAHALKHFAKSRVVDMGLKIYSKDIATKKAA
jgi:glycosyltransferase involved in cell wall biosynthesis